MASMLLRCVIVLLSCSVLVTEGRRKKKKTSGWTTPGTHDSYSYSHSHSHSHSKSKSKDDYGYHYEPRLVKSYSKCTEGVIQGFFGDPAMFPDGFQLCDGSNGTPDLRDRFLVGAGHDFHFGDEGGAAEVVLEEDNLPIHAHGTGSLYTETAGLHKHEFDAVTDGGEHYHELIDLVTNKEPDHQHEIETKTDQAGEHDHVLDAFDPADYDSHPDDVDMGIPVQAIDITKSYPFQTDQDPGHQHGFDGLTGPEGAHQHEVKGSVGGDGDGEHYHNIHGTTDPFGEHGHPVLGDTGDVGNNDPVPILNPFSTIYWICCPAQPEPTTKKPDWYR